MRKYITGYDDNTISPLQFFLPKMTGYLNIFKDGGRKLSFLLIIMNFWKDIL